MSYPEEMQKQHAGKIFCTTPNWCFYVIVFFAALIIIFLRRPDAILNPQFWAEDGAVFYAHTYHKGIVIPLLSQYAGYLDTFPRLVAALSQFFPLSWAPLLFNLSGMMIKALPVVWILSSRLHELMPDLKTKLFFSFLYLSLPNSWEVNTGLQHGKIYLALLAFMVICSLTDGRLRTSITDAGLLLLSGLSGPFCFMLAPISALYWFFRRNRRSFALFAILFLCALIQAIVFLSATASRPPRMLGESPLLFVEILAEQVFLGALIGQAGLEKLISFPGLFNFAVIISGSAGVAACIYALIKGPLQLRIFIAYAFLLFCAALASPMVNLKDPQWPLLLVPGVGGRYWFIPMLAFISVLVWLLRKKGPHLSRGLAVAAFAIMLLGIIVDWRYPVFQDLSFKEYAYRFESAPTGTRTTIPINPPGWSITLIKH
jgi:hypothetical protein